MGLTVLFFIFCYYILLQWLMLVVNMAKVNTNNNNSNEVSICTGNPCKPKAQTSNCFNCLF